jgi:Hydantoinase/oxoprolinase N-terminal region
MSCNLGLVVGESFAEIIGYTPSVKTPVAKARWYLPKKSLADGLREVIENTPEAKEGGKIWFASHAVERILNRRQGRAPGVLVTSGFESWLTATQPSTSAQFSNQARRLELPLLNEATFGVSERVLHDGQITTPVGIEELQAIAQKLELLKIKDVVVLYLHADVNSANEKATASFLTEKGFRVQQSHQFSGKSLADRWIKTLEAGFAQSAVGDELEQIQEALQDENEETDVVSKWQVFAWTSSDLQSFAEMNSRLLRGGPMHALASAASHSLKKQKGARALLHCGLDSFTLIDQSGQATSLSIQLTQGIQHGVWHFPTLSNSAMGYEPGPMLFGRSHQLAIIDILFLMDRLKEIEAFTPLLAEKSRNRIQETLFTLAKSPLLSLGDKKRTPDAMSIAADLEQAFIEKLAVELALCGVQDSLHLTGPFADSIKPMLSLRRPDLRLSSNDNDTWYEAQACLPTEIMAEVLR